MEYALPSPGDETFLRGWCPQGRGGSSPPSDTIQWVPTQQSVSQVKFDGTGSPPPLEHPAAEGQAQPPGGAVAPARAGRRAPRARVAALGRRSGADRTHHAPARGPPGAGLGVDCSGRQPRRRAGAAPRGRGCQPSH